MLLNLSRILDAATRQALETIQDTINAAPVIAGGFKLVSFATTGSVSGGVLIHNLGFIPTDLIETKHVGGAVTWHWESATKTTIKYTTSGAVDIRALIGRI